MCGLAGFQGLALTEQSRALLVWALGEGTDTRGGHAVGFVSTDANNNIAAHRRLGRWGDKDATRFVMSASRGVSTMIHARFATCGTRGVNDAHPFTIKRAGETVLHGMHNGMLYNARESALVNNREYSVDSRELFELLADKDLDAIGKLEGYGVITWVDAGDPETIYFCRISDDGELYAATVKGGGVVWGSTKRIVKHALEVVGLSVEQEFEFAHGIVHSARGGSFWMHEEFKVRVADRYKSYIDRQRTSGGSSFAFGSWRDSDVWENAERRAIQRDAEENDFEFQVELDEEEEELLMLEDEARKLELCELWSIDPEEVADLSFDELDEYVNDLFSRSEQRSMATMLSKEWLSKEGKSGNG